MRGQRLRRARLPARAAAAIAAAAATATAASAATTTTASAAAIAAAAAAAAATSLTTAAAAATETTATTAAATSATATASASLTLFVCRVHAKRTTVEHLPVHRVCGSASLVVRRILDEPEATRPSRLTIDHDGSGHHLPMRAERVFELLIHGAVREVPNV
jgi:hypothetical protein